MVMEDYCATKIGGMVLGKVVGAEWPGNDKKPSISTSPPQEIKVKSKKKNKRRKMKPQREALEPSKCLSHRDMITSGLI